MNDSALSSQCGSYGGADCPCVLSVLKECLVCSHLQGKELCDCQWSKYCVFINFLHDQKSFLTARHDFLSPVRRLCMHDCGYRVFLAAPSQVLGKAGNLRLAMLESRPPLDLKIPAVVLSAYPDQGLICLGVSSSGGAGLDSLPASCGFDLHFGKEYAIQGLDQLRNMSGQRALVVAEGFGQLLAAPLVGDFLLPGNQVSVILSSPPAISRKLEEMSVSYRTASPIDAEALAGALAEGRYDLCFSLGPSSLHHKVKDALSSLENGIPHYASSYEK